MPAQGGLSASHDSWAFSLMHDKSIWSLSLGRWRGVRVRLHVSFILFAVFTLFLSWHEAQRAGGENLIWVAWASLLILLTSVLVHELAHCQAALRSGLAVDQIIVGPFGGWLPIRCPGHPQRELAIILAGPLVQVIVCLCCAPLLTLVVHCDIAGLLHPLKPVAVAEGTLPAVALKLTFWINWLLLLVNLIPAYPFDGGQALRAGILVVWPELGPRWAALRLANLVKMAAIALLVVAWIMRNYEPGGLVPIWLALVILAIFLFFSARIESERREENERDDELFGYDFSQGYTSLEECKAPPIDMARPKPLTRWLVRRRRVRHQQQSEVEAEEDRRVDEILSRLHETGLKGLSARDRKLLDQVSARYRSRKEG